MSLISESRQQMATPKVLRWPVDGRGQHPKWGPYARVSPTKRQIRDARKSGTLTVREDEQRGTDPVTGTEILNPRKMEFWLDLELKNELFMGQLNYSLD